MNYYLDTEFNEDFYTPLFGRRRHFIDLISIALIAEDGRRYYAVSKDFDLKAAWNKHDLWLGEMGDAPVKEYWLRENVLRPLHTELYSRLSGFARDQMSYLQNFTYKNLKSLIHMYGKTNDQIAAEIEGFTAGLWECTLRQPQFFMPLNSSAEIQAEIIEKHRKDPPIFYAYYADYDWVLFCSLFGKMIDLPKGYPMYCRDLQQMIDETNLPSDWKSQISHNVNVHLAISDAEWNQKVHKYLLQFKDYKDIPTTRSY